MVCFRQLCLAQLMLLKVTQIEFSRLQYVIQGLSPPLHFNLPTGSLRFMGFRYQIACSAGILLGQVNIKKHMMVYSSSHVRFGFGLIWWRVGVKKGKIFTLPPHPSFFIIFFFYFFYFFLLSLTPLVQISFFSQPSATFKIKVGGHNFC